LEEHVAFTLRGQGVEEDCLTPTLMATHSILLWKP